MHALAVTSSAGLGDFPKSRRVLIDMLWDSLLGHHQQFQWFGTALAQNRLGSSFLFVGPHGIGKRTFARLLAQSLLCRCAPSDQLQPCGVCEDCAQVRASTHPDLIEIAKPKEKSEMPLELLIGSNEKRMREGLCYEISLRPFSGRRKIAIIDDADTLNDEGANALLKTLEEPPENSLLMLIATSLQRQLPTIRSRCQTVLFRSLHHTELTKIILKQQLVSTPEDAALLAAASEGSVLEARQLSDPQLMEFKELLLDELTKRPIDFLELSKACSNQADSAGKEARLKRERLKWIFRFSGNFYRNMVFMQIDEPVYRLQCSQLDSQLISAASRALRQWSSGPNGAMACWRVCLQAIDQVDRNANQATLLQAWSAKLAQLSEC